jgi:hypothetical protein
LLAQLSLSQHSFALLLLALPPEPALALETLISCHLASPVMPGHLAA